MTMKKIACLALVVLLAVILGACAGATPQTAAEMINPGDKIGDFLITTGEEGNVNYWDQDCVQQGKQGEEDVYSCKANVGTKINMSTGLYDDSVSSAPATATSKLVEDWSAFDYQLFIEGRPVNLPAFGYIDVHHPLRGVIRFWNVVIVTERPGEINFRESGVADGDPFKAATTYTFSAAK
jgi:hypothetical protein